MKVHTLILFIFSIGCLSISCNEEVSVGADLIDDQPISAEFNDEVRISAKTVNAVEDFIGYANRGNFERRPYLIGELDDPNFGRTSSKIFVTPRIDNSNIPDFNISIIDSVILTLPYDTIGTYGDASTMHHISVHRLSESPNLELTDTLLVDMCLDYEPSPITELDIIPAPLDSIDIFSPFVDTIISVVPQLRFELDKDFWQNILNDTIYLEDTQSLVDQVNGYAIVSEPDNSSMFGINLLSNSIAAIEIFYTDSISGVYNFDLSTLSNDLDNRSETSIKHSCFESDYSGSEVLRTLGDSLSEYNYLEGMDGFNIEYNISEILNLDSSFINFAVLDLYLLEDENTPIRQLRCEYQNSEGEFIDISDFGNTPISTFFDGSLQETSVNGMTIMKYKIILTNHLINFKNGDITSPFIYVTPFNRDLARHAIIHSPNHPTLPSKLNLITTKP